MEFENVDKNEELEKIRHFKGSVKDLKNLMDKKAGENTNSMNDVEYEYPNKKSGKDTSPVYQTFGIVNNPIKEQTFKKFEDFVSENIVVGGFAAPMYPSGYGLGWSNYRSYSGYDLQPVAGIIDTLSSSLSENAKAYEENDNKDHTAIGYLKEADKMVKEKLKQCYEKWQYSDANESFEETFEDFDAAAKNDALKKRNEYNKDKLEAAKAKGNKNSEELYKLKLELDKIDFEKTKIKAEIQKLKDQMKTQ